MSANLRKTSEMTIFDDGGRAVGLLGGADQKLQNMCTYTYLYHIAIFFKSLNSFSIHFKSVSYIILVFH